MRWLHPNDSVQAACRHSLFNVAIEVNRKERCASIDGVLKHTRCAPFGQSRLCYDTNMEACAPLEHWDFYNMGSTPCGWREGAP
jgi:hypothetical protein